MILEAVPAGFTWNKLSASIPWANPNEIKRVTIRMGILEYALRHVDALFINLILFPRLNYLSCYESIKQHENVNELSCSSATLLERQTPPTVLHSIVLLSTSILALYVAPP